MAGGYTVNMSGVCLVNKKTCYTSFILACFNSTATLDAFVVARVLRIVRNGVRGDRATGCAAGTDLYEGNTSPFQVGMYRQ